MFTGGFDDDGPSSDGVIIGTKVHGALHYKNVLILWFDTEVCKASTVKVLKPET